MTGRRAYSSLLGVVTTLVLALATMQGSATAEPAAPPGDPEQGERVENGTRGQWRVAIDADGSRVAQWRSPDPLPVTDARPEVWLGDETFVGYPQLAPDGRTLTIPLPDGINP
ncbi:MAG: hypothetical protein GEU93_08450 [Propionibacteriales bacterium]|nr:hypothetical protein [Propionibacteriales bacterium]